MARGTLRRQRPGKPDAPVAIGGRPAHNESPRFGRGLSLYKQGHALPGMALDPYTSIGVSRGWKRPSPTLPTYLRWSTINLPRRNTLSATP